MSPPFLEVQQCGSEKSHRLPWLSSGVPTVITPPGTHLLSDVSHWYEVRAAQKVCVCLCLLMCVFVTLRVCVCVCVCVWLYLDAAIGYTTYLLSFMLFITQNISSIVYQHRMV